MEKEIKLKNNGFPHLFLGLILTFSPLSLIVLPKWPFGVITLVLCLAGLIWLMGLFIITLNQTRVLIFFGKYKGTVKTDGFYWLNPFYTKKRVSLRGRNLETEIIKVNDEQGNPVLISSVVVWKIVDTYKAVFDIEASVIRDPSSGVKKENWEDSYQRFVKIQSEAALRNIAQKYPYDDVEEGADHITLRSGVEKINEDLEEEIRNRVSIAGIEVQEARISNLSYAPEIAAVMLQRQQAQAIITARKKIVEGSVGIVEMALQALEEKVEISQDQKATLVGNLLVVLSSEVNTTPVINTN
ncbi:MAG TPA: band 7 protein [Cytophagales bacterium]|nr:band 7 protein [Cytophagales bacterium]